MSESDHRVAEPPDETSAGEPEPQPTLIGRARAHATRLGERAHAERTHHGSVDAMFEMADHDSEIGGGIMAGALAYRLFIWLLPLALVAIAGLGIASNAGSSTPEEAAKSMGLAGIVSSSVAGAANSPARWYAVLIGIPLLALTTRSILRTLIVIHRLVWTETRGAVPKPTWSATLQLLAALLGFFVISTLATAARESSVGGGLLVILVIPLPYAALWLLISSRLPHRGSTWQALIPGAFLFGIGIQVLHLVTAYFIAPQAGSKQGTYGSLGIAAALLLGLFLISRLVVATAVVNATLWARRSRAG